MAGELEREEYVSWCWEAEFKEKKAKETNKKCVYNDDTWMCIVHGIPGV